MNETKHILLLNETLQPPDARQRILTVLSGESHFHVLQGFGKKVSGSKEYLSHEKALSELKFLEKDILLLLDSAAGMGKKVGVTINIDLSIQD